MLDNLLCLLWVFSLHCFLEGHQMPERFRIIALTMAAVFICYIDRVVISLTIIPMGAELGWNNTEKGIVLGSFYLAYMVTQIYGGILSDRIGAKIVLGVGLITWSLFTLVTPLAAAAGFTILILARLGMGLGEGVTFPRGTVFMLDGFPRASAQDPLPRRTAPYR